MNEPTNQRKIEHIDIIRRDPHTDRNLRAFDRMHLQHRALPELNLSEIDTSLTFLGKPLSFPLLISSMTGGDHDLVRTVNHNLARAAEVCQVAMGVGSQRVMFTHPQSRPSFALRDTAPTALLFANLGAVQLNKGFDATSCQAAIDALNADGLYLHLNPLQEAVQPEGDTCFRGLAQRIGQMVRELNTPILVKEIGCGLSQADADLLIAHGVRMLDVAGSGGTSWSRIEHHRAGTSTDQLGVLFQDWGIPTPDALQLLAPHRKQGVTLIASGGLRDALDMIKSIILGASLCGMAKPFLEPALISPEAVIDKIESLHRAFRTAMFLLGCPTLSHLQGNDDLLRQPCA